MTSEQVRSHGRFRVGQLVRVHKGDGFRSTFEGVIEAITVCKWTPEESARQICPRTEWVLRVDGQTAGIYDSVTILQEACVEQKDGAK